MKKFDYKSDYKKFNPKSEVKITFMDGKEEVTKKVHIISINAKGLSFEDKENIYECTPAEVKNIQKRSKKILFLAVVTIVFLILIFTGKLIKNFWDRHNDNKYQYYHYEEVQSYYGVDWYK